MAAETTQDRTEQATPRRQEESRRKGQVAVSAELNSGFHLLVGSTLLWFLGSLIGPQLLSALKSWLPAIADADGSFGQIRDWFAHATIEVFAICGAIIGILFLSGLLLGLLQSGFNFSLEPLQINWSKLSPISGFGRLFSMRSTVKGIAAVLKVSVVAAIVGWILWARFDEIASSGLLTLGGSLALGWEVSIQLMMCVAVALTVIGGFDYLFQRWKHEQDLMMSKQEIKEEHKQEEGDPLLKARIRRLQRETAQRRMMTDVPRATVVITNPTHLAIALQYDADEMEAPKVLAKGAGTVALRIRRIAEENGVPVVERKPLARALYQLVEVGSEIPLELFQAVAEILVYIYGLRRAA